MLYPMTSPLDDWLRKVNWEKLIEKSWLKKDDWERLIEKDWLGKDWYKGWSKRLGRSDDG